MTPVIVLVAVTCAIIGALIGEPRGMRVSGMFMGLLLGPIGLLIIALQKREPGP